MAKSGKITFRDTIADYQQLMGRIRARQFAPIYLLMGEEGYFIDQVCDLLGNTILNEAEKAFGQVTVYGKDTEVGAIINQCRQMPMGSPYQVVIVREAQQLRRIEQLSLYTAQPLGSTILILCHKEKNLDKRTQLYKSIAEKGAVLESVRPRDYEIGPWLTDYLKGRKLAIEPKAAAMLTDHLGSDIAKIVNELDKLLTSLPVDTQTITADHIEQNIGISKDFNNFELTKAISEKDMAKALLIADHFARNPKDNPLLVTISALFTHFQRIFILNYQRWLSRHRGTPVPADNELSRMLKLPNPFFLGEYKQAATLYPNKKVFIILGLLREYDLKSKGMNAGTGDSNDLLRELLLKIFLL